MENNFSTTCVICGFNDSESVWEVVSGTPLCVNHQEEWYQTGLHVNAWVQLRLLEETDL